MAPEWEVLCENAPRAQLVPDRCVAQFDGTQLVNRHAMDYLPKRVIPVKHRRPPVSGRLTAAADELRQERKHEVEGNGEAAAFQIVPGCHTVLCAYLGKAKERIATITPGSAAGSGR
jgi:hypothetical protein